jgi:hypothetical protein
MSRVQVQHVNKGIKGAVLNLPASSVNGVPRNMVHEIITVPSTSQPAFSSFFVIDVKENNISIHDLTLAFNVSALTGLTVYPTQTPTLTALINSNVITVSSATGLFVGMKITAVGLPANTWITNISGTTIYVNSNTTVALSGTASSIAGEAINFVPFTLALQKLDIVIGGNVIDTIYPAQNFLLQNLYNIDEDRVYVNNQMGNYSSPQQRNLMATQTSNYFVNLKTLFNQVHLTTLTPNHQIQLRVYMNNLQDCVGYASGTPVATINSCNLVARVSRISPEAAQNKLLSISQQPAHNYFLESRFGLFQIPSGNSSSQIVLTPIVGSVAFLFFVVRNTTNVTQSLGYQYQPVTNWQLLGSSGENIVGGVALSSALCLQVLNQYWIESTFTSETSLGLTDNKANVYMWSFSADPITTMKNASQYSSRSFYGNEQLVIQWQNSLVNPVQVDVYAMCNSAIEQGAGYIKKMSL